MSNTYKTLEEILQVAINDYKAQVAILNEVTEKDMAMPLHLMRELVAANAPAKVAYSIRRSIVRAELDLPSLKARLESQKRFALERNSHEVLEMERASNEAVISLYDDLLCNCEG